MRARLPGIVALAVPVLAGLTYLVTMGAPRTYALINGGALILAAVLVATLPRVAGTKAKRIFAAALIVLLFIPLASGPYLNGIARWLPVGPFAVHSGALFLPALVVLAARDEEYAPSMLLAALLAASLQPDAATALAVMLSAVGLYNANKDWRLVPVAGIALFASMVAALRGELPAQPFVERVLVSLAFQQPLAALALAFALLAGFLIVAHGINAERRVRHALAGCLFGFTLAAVFSNYPSILIGYGAAPILGFGLAIGLATGKARQTT